MIWPQIIVIASELCYLIPKTIEKLNPKCYSWKWLLKIIFFKTGLVAILDLGLWYHSWLDGDKCHGILSCLWTHWLILCENLYSRLHIIVWTDDPILPAALWGIGFSSYPLPAALLGIGFSSYHCLQVAPD